MVITSDLLKIKFQNTVALLNMYIHIDTFGIDVQEIRIIFFISGVTDLALARVLFQFLNKVSQ